MLMMLFVVAAVGMRFLPHAWNFTPVVAMLLLAGAFMKRKQLWVPILALVASDFALNLWVYRTPGAADQYFTWSAYLIILGMALWALPGRVRWMRVGTTTIAGSCIFFLISNFGVWMTGTMYPRTMGGLITCYGMGVPFFRSAALGDLLYAGAFFGVYALLTQRQSVTVAG
jgi:hypothetical protein